MTPIEIIEFLKPYAPAGEWEVLFEGIKDKEGVSFTGRITGFDLDPGPKKDPIFQVFIYTWTDLDKFQLLKAFAREYYACIQDLIEYAKFWEKK